MLFSKPGFCLSVPGIVLACLLSSCAVGTPTVTLKGETFTVEIAESPEQQAQGLMFRDSLAEGHGMLFTYRRPQPQSFWMKNVKFPIDILFFDGEQQLINVAARARPCRREPCRSYRSEGPAQYVLELNAGVAESLGVKPGDRLELHLD